MSRCFYQLQGRIDEHSWRVVGGPFLYCELQAAKADAHLLLARYASVRVINKNTGQMEYIAGRVHR